MHEKGKQRQPLSHHQRKLHWHAQAYCRSRCSFTSRLLSMQKQLRTSLLTSSARSHFLGACLCSCFFLSCAQLAQSVAMVSQRTDTHVTKPHCRFFVSGDVAVEPLRQSLTTLTASVLGLGRFESVYRTAKMGSVTLKPVSRCTSECALCTAGIPLQTPQMLCVLRFVTLYPCARPSQEQQMQATDLP